MEKRKSNWTILIWFMAAVMFLAACGSGQSDSSSEESDPGESLPSLNTPVSQGGAPEDETENPSYPPPVPTPTVVSGYPDPAPVATYDPYPGGVAIMVHAVGQQCEDDTFFNDLDDAVKQLNAEGIEVFEAEEVDLIVCAACSCPTSAHYRIVIDPDNYGAAESMGWRREQ